MSTQDPFENTPLIVLYGMVADAKPEDLSGRATALGQAAFDLEDLSVRIGHMISDVEWHGEGGDAFHKWSQQFVSSTQQLTDYTKGVAQIMADTGQVLHEVKPTVLPPPVGAFVYAPNTPMAKQASAAMEADRQEAISQINKLVSAYKGATLQFTAAKNTAPTYQPLPSAMLPKDARIGGSQTQIPAGGPEEATPVRSDTGSQPNTTVAEAQPGQESGLVAPSATPSARKVSPTAPSTSLDSTAPASVAQRPHAVSVPHAPTKPHSGGGPVPFVPGIMGLPGLLGKPSVGGGGALPVEPLPTVGSGPGAKSRVPSTVVGDEGIVGGTPSASSRGLTPKLPHGVVVGEERSPSTRSPVGGARYAGAGNLSSGVVGGAPARRLASEHGGEMSAPRPGTGSACEYTPGGSGLRRSPTALTEEGVGNGGSGHPTGSVAGARPGAVRDVRGRRGSRPDYLVEDEETWMAGGRDVVPPVVD